MRRFIPGSIDSSPRLSKVAVFALLILCFGAVSAMADAEANPASETEAAATPPEPDAAATAASPEAAAPPADTPAYIYEVERITFEISRWTRPKSVLALLRFERGARFTSVEELTATLERFERDLYNQRVFDDVRVTFELIPGDDLPRKVVVHFYLDDGWTLLPIPFYRYNSNTGHNPFVVLYWDNFLGTLTDFGFSAGYYSRTWPEAFGWDVRVDLKGIRMLDRSWSFGFDQEYQTVEKADPNGELLLRYSYYTSDFGMSTRFRLSDNWSYKISPGFGASYGYHVERNKLDDPIPDDQVALSFSHGVGTGRQDWYRNFREGWNFGFGNTLAYGVTDGEVSADVDMSGEYFRIFGVFNPGVRGKVEHYFGGDQLSKGGDIRGVSNARIFGQTFLKANTNVAIRVLDIPKFSEFNLNPFLDLALALPQGETIGEEHFFAGAGADLVIFPHFLRGFQGRISFGIDLRDPPTSIGDFGSYELAISETLAF